MILCIETATPVCSVVLCDSAGRLLKRESRETKSHASLLTIFIQELLHEAGIRSGQLDAVAVSKGPGSYTGLRIGVSVAKGISYGASVPLIGVETTRSMYNGIINASDQKYGTDSSSLFCPMIDARRMEVYYSLFDRQGKVIKDISAEVINEESFTGINESMKIVFFGDGAEKCRDMIGHKNSIFVDDFTISASSMCKSAFEAFNSGQFEDVAYFEPFYLKNFIATVPRKNILLK
jgi:tRNA threonylcarbamoyladenosine biosynthesis protein TsaB